MFWSDLVSSYYAVIAPNPLNVPQIKPIEIFWEAQTRNQRRPELKLTNEKLMPNLVHNSSIIAAKPKIQILE